MDSSIGNNTENITIKQGEEFALHFESNPTTGYQWIPAFNESIIILTAHTFKPSTRLKGAPGIDNFVFKGISRGTTSLELLYKKSWEKGSIKEEVYLVNVV